MRIFIPQLRTQRLQLRVIELGIVVGSLIMVGTIVDSNLQLMN